MGHDWVVEVLEDLCLYARANDLPQTMQKVQQALDVAKGEIGVQDTAGIQPMQNKIVPS